VAVTDHPVPLCWVDAFSDGPFTGNPAAVCVLERPAPEGAMQSLAFELGLSETAFVWPDEGAFGLRWFTPVAEVALCGHATVAAAHVLAATGRLAGGTVRFSTLSGTLEATVEGDLVEIDLPADTPAPVATPPALSARWPVARAASGRFDLLVEFDEEEAVRRVDPGEVHLAGLPYRGIAVTSPGEEADYVLRFFAPRVGVPEDPVTGSAQCLLGPYWAGVLGKTDLRAAQVSARGGALRVRVVPDRVRVAGRATTVLAGAVTGEAARRLHGLP
jgi:PhzF family phenazine biosynthesis protein